MKGSFTSWGKGSGRTWAMHNETYISERYEAKPMLDYGVVPVSRAMGQAFLTSNMENMTIPFHINKF